MVLSVEGISETLLNAVIILLSLIFGGGIVSVLVWLGLRWKKFYEFKCIIWKKDAFDKVEEVEDDAGVFVDSKTKYKRLFLKKANVSLSADDIPFIRRGKRRVIYLEQYGLKNFRYLRPSVGDDGIRISVGEEDVNWAVVSYERGKKAFSTDKLLQYMPFIMLGFVSLVILIMFIYLFKQLGSIGELFEAAESLAHAIAQAKTGTVVVNP